jgi:hypothetical protein
VEVKVLVVLGSRMLVERLIRCGYTESKAISICKQYLSSGKVEELESYVKEKEMIDSGFDW